VTLHARNADRAAQAHAAVPQAEGVLLGDLSSIEETKQLAAKANQAGPWDCVVHNAGVGHRVGSAISTDGMRSLFQINSLAPYILTCLMNKPKRLLYLSSSLHTGGSDNLENDITWVKRTYDGFTAYSDS
jgi:short-subunit dehydrogenase